MPIDDDLLNNIHTLIDQVGQGTSETLLELLARIVTAETIAVQLQSRVEQDRADRAASEAQLRAALHELRLLVWGILAILGVIVLILVIATIASMARGS
jgi:uncharacterized membrane protein